MLTKTDFETLVDQAQDFLDSESISDLTLLAERTSALTAFPDLADHPDPTDELLTNAMALNQMLTAEQKNHLREFALHLSYARDALEGLSDGF